MLQRVACESVFLLARLIGLALMIALLCLGAARASGALPVIEHPSPDELARGFAIWADRYPERFTFESRGTTLEGRPILMGRITDLNVPDEDKQVALFTSAHGPAEVGAMTGLLHTMKWLLGDSPEARGIRARQVVLIVPYCDPDRVADGSLRQTRQVYGGWAAKGVRLWSIDGAALPDEHPEARALQGVMDQYRPDLYIDVHGVKHEHRTMWDSTGVSWGSAVSRSYLHDVPRFIDDIAEAEGFLITRGEQDAGKTRTTSPVEGFPDYLYYLRRNAPIITEYAYGRYHTLAFIIESGSSQSTVSRLRAALQVGQQRWRYERYVGYPVNQIAIWTPIAVSAWGTTAAERRRSRVELWQKNPQISLGTASPTPRDGTLTGYVSTTLEGRSRVRGRRVIDVVDELRGDPRFDAAGLADAAARYSHPQSFGGPREVYKPIDGGVDHGPIEHGLVVRLLIPYRDATVTEVRRDGRVIDESAAEGYHVRHGPGTVVEIAIPPDAVRDLHLVSCHYDTPTRRTSAFTDADW